MLPPTDPRSIAAQPATPGTAGTGTQAIDRALDVLSCFSAAAGDLGVVDVAERSGLTTSTTHRVLRALVGRGYLQQESASGRYRLGPSSVILGRVAQRSFGLDEALPVLEQVAEKTGESVNMGVRQGSHAIVLLQVGSRQPLRFEQPPGTVVPLDLSAMGKCLLAFASETPHHDAASEQFRKELRRVRERGYSVDDEESVQGVRCVGAPILGQEGTAIAALAIQGPAVRFPHGRLPELAELAMVTAAQVAAALRVMDPQDAIDA